MEYRDLLKMSESELRALGAKKRTRKMVRQILRERVHRMHNKITYRQAQGSK